MRVNFARRIRRERNAAHMAKGTVILVGTLVVVNLAVGTIGFALKHNRFPYGISELVGWLF